MIYMDNAATTKMTPAVIQTMLLCMEDIWHNPSSLYAPAQKAAEALRDARARIAACLNASPVPRQRRRANCSRIYADSTRSSSSD